MCDSRLDFGQKEIATKDIIGRTDDNYVWAMG